MRLTNPSLPNDVEASSKSIGLGQQLVIDTVAGTIASFGVSAFITVLDRSIIENAAGVTSISNGIKRLSKDLIRNPLGFIQRNEFKVVFGLYAATYVAANSTETICEWQQVDHKVPKLIATTAVNMPLCVWKDRHFAVLFGVVPKHHFPIVSLGLFAIRDFMTVVSSFNSPYVLAKRLEKAGMEYSIALKVSQFACPATAQLFSAPLHLLGLNLYNHQGSTMMSHLRFLKSQYWRTSAARVARIIPAFGAGGIGNRFLRESMQEKCIHFKLMQ